MHDPLLSGVKKGGSAITKKINICQNGAFWGLLGPLWAPFGPLQPPLWRAGASLMPPHTHLLRERREDSTS